LLARRLLHTHFHKTPRSRKEKALFANEIVKAHKRIGEFVMRKRWSLAVHHEDRSEGSLISENHFIHFADVHATMKKNKGRTFVIRVPETAKPMEIQAIHNLKNLGYAVEAR